MAGKATTTERGRRPPGGGSGCLKTPKPTLVTLRQKGGRPEAPKLDAGDALA